MAGAKHGSCGPCSSCAAGFAAVASQRGRRPRPCEELPGGTVCSLRSVAQGAWSLPHWFAYHGYAAALPFWPPLAGAVGASGSYDSRSQVGLWTPLHCAATRGHTRVVEALLRRACDVGAVDAGGHDALMVAAARHHSCIVRALLKARASAQSVDAKGHSPLHFATASADSAAVELLLQSQALPNAADGDGQTALVVATSKEARWPVALILLERRADVAVKTHSRGVTPLMQVVEWNPALGCQAVKELLQRSADVGAEDRFGSTALHVACRRGAPEIVAALCMGGATPLVQDHDGLYPLLLLTERCAQNPEDTSLVDIAMAAILAAAPEAASVLDFGDASSLHNLCLHAGRCGTAPLRAIRALVASAADPSVEEEGGWTAAHFAAQASGEAAAAMLAELSRSPLAQAEFWKCLDLTKKRDGGNRKYLSRRGGHTRIPLEERLDVLRGANSIAGVAQRVLSGRSRGVVVLMGAGASTSAGIPDFRSPAGLWRNDVTRELFSAHGFVSQPEVFWREAANLFLDRVPTRVHKLLALLAEKRLLQRVYTQNVDGLEVEAGVPSNLVIDCHGSILRSVCSQDRSHHSGAGSLVQIAAKLTAGAEAPRCAICGALVRPDIVFFGEPLPAAFGLHSSKDLWDCDLLIVMGTALSVYPVAGLVNQVRPLTPRLLVNRDAVGPWRAAPGEAGYRDVFFQGECDAGAEELAVQLGWNLT